MKKKMVIICAVFALIISCNNYTSGEDLKQNVKEQVKGIKQGVEIERKIKQGVEIERKIKQGIEEQVKGFLEKKEGIISDDEIAKKLREEEKDKQEELMQGDDSNNPNDNLNQSPILQANSQDSKPELEAVQQSESGGQQKEEAKEEQAKAKAEAEKEERERKQEQEKRRQEEERERKQEQEVKAKIKDLTNKIDKINKDIDSIKHQSWFVEEVERVIVEAQEVIDKVTGPIYDYFTDKSDTAIYYTWGLADEEDSELGKVLEKLSETRSDLRTKLNVGNKKPVVLSRTEPELKENVKVSEIESDLEKLKSELEEVKNYLEDESNFEKIKEYVDEDEDED